MADRIDPNIPWYQQKKWVVTAGLICGAGLGLLLLEPVVDDIVPALLNEDSTADTSAPEPATPDEPDTSATDTTAEGSTPDAPTDDEPDSTNGSNQDPSEDDQPEQAYDLVVFATRDVSVDDTAMKVLSAELNVFPAEKNRLRDALNAEIEEFRGETHAVSVNVFYDRREGPSPAFGSWDWAPDGDWSKAEDGDPETWGDYEWSEPQLQKFDEPEACEPPGERQLELSGAYHEAHFVEAPDPGQNQDNDNSDSDDNDDRDDGDEFDGRDDSEEPVPSTVAPDADVMNEVAESMGTTADLLADALSATSAWVAC